MNKLAILGASGHGKVVAEAALLSGFWAEVIFYDDNWPIKTQIGPFNIVGDTNSLLNESKDFDVIVAIGDNTTRRKKLQFFKDNGFSIATVIHPKSIISVSAKIGEGSVVMAGAVINSDAEVGNGCIINTNATIEHDCHISDAVHISPGANLAGGVKVHQNSWIGIGTSVIQEIIIGSNVTVGSGSTVISNIPDNSLALGVPAKVIKTKAN